MLNTRWKQQQQQQKKNMNENYFFKKRIRIKWIRDFFFFFFYFENYFIKNSTSSLIAWCSQCGPTWDTRLIFLVRINFVKNILTHECCMENAAILHFKCRFYSQFQQRPSFVNSALIELKISLDVPFPLHHHSSRSESKSCRPRKCFLISLLCSSPAFFYFSER